jgi:type IV secretion system protein VirB1
MGAALSAALVLSIAARAAPTVAPDTILAFAQYESGLDPLAIHDNTSGRSYHPDTRGEAFAIAVELVREGHSFDSGVMQVNSGQLENAGITLWEAFDPRHSMRAGSRILKSAYALCGGETAHSQDQQTRALRCAAARYNTGADGPAGHAYAARVWRVAEKFVPSISRLITADFPSAAPGGLTSTKRGKPPTNTPP